jgi:nitroreductase
LALETNSFVKGFWARLTRTIRPPLALELEKAVRKRRMVRHFTIQPVPESVVSRILDLAQHAPSAGFSQGSAYIVVTKSEMKRKIALLQGESEYVGAGFHGWISEAPVAIIPCVSEKLYHDRYNEPDKLQDGKEIDWPTPYWFFDIGAGCMIILLAAVDAGFAAAFSGATDPPGIRKLVGIPEHFHPVGVISIGHPAKDKRSPSLKRGRRPPSQVVHYERW